MSNDIETVLHPDVDERAWNYAVALYAHDESIDEATADDLLSLTSSDDDQLRGVIGASRAVIAVADSEQAELRVELAKATLDRDHARHERDTLRAKVESLADGWEREADEIRDAEGEERDGPSAAMVGIAHGRHKSANDLRAALGVSSRP